MKRFKDKYKCFYNNIKADEKLRETILNNTLKEKKFNLRNDLFANKLILAISSFLIIVLIGSSIIFAKDISALVKSCIYKLIPNSDTKNATNTCMIYNPINKKVNCSITFDENVKSITNRSLEESLGIHILDSDIYNDDMVNIKEIIKIDNKLAALKLTKNTITGKIIDEKAWNNSKINLSISFLTKYATDKIKEDTFSFKKGNCNEKDFEIITIDSMKLDVYFVSMTVNAYEDLKFMIKAYFVYDDILYDITGELVSRDMIINFIKSLK